MSGEKRKFIHSGSNGFNRNSSAKTAVQHVATTTGALAQIELQKHDPNIKSVIVATLIDFQMHPYVSNYQTYCKHNIILKLHLHTTETIERFFMKVALEAIHLFLLLFFLLISNVLFTNRTFISSIS